MTTLDSILTDALAAARAANRTITLASLALIGTRALADAPEATVLPLEWSDQGDYLSACDLDDLELDPEVQDAIDDYLSEYAYNLDGGSQSIWSEFGTWDGHPDRGRFMLDLARAATAIEIAA